MPLAPSQMQMLRKGPAMGPPVTPGGMPGATPGGMPGGPPGAGLPATPGAESPGNILMTAIAHQVNQQKKANSNFASGNVDQAMRVIGAMMIHLMQSHPEVARHLNRAWSSLDAAKKALSEATEEATPAGPPLGFSGAQIGPSDQMGGPGMAPGMGMGPR